MRPEWKPAAYDRDGVADWMEDHLYGRLHASLVGSRWAGFDANG